MQIKRWTGNKENQRFLESVVGSNEDAWKAAFKYGDILRNRFSVKSLTVAISVRFITTGTYYLYLETEATQCRTPK